MRKHTHTQQRNFKKWGVRFSQFALVFLMTSLDAFKTPLAAKPVKTIDQIVECDTLVVGGGLSGVATAYEALLSGQTVCLTEISDWLGGQISSQGNSALDETAYQRKLNHFPGVIKN